jgi:ABC-type lipoprotein release transport system permease subunit
LRSKVDDAIVFDPNVRKNRTVRIIAILVTFFIVVFTTIVVVFSITNGIEENTNQVSQYPTRTQVEEELE